MATVELGRTEEWFWDVEPRKMYAMSNAYTAMEKAKAKHLAVTLVNQIAIALGAEVDEEDDGPLEGRDIGASDATIAALMGG
jgi:hypothetical protein